MPTEPSPSERRIEELNQEAFELAVVKATEAATQHVARIHRIRLVTQSAAASFLVALAVAAIVAVVLGSNQADANYANSLSNCRLVKNLSQPLADFVANDAALRGAQLKIALKDRRYTLALNKLFGKSEVGKLEGESNRLTGQSVHYWTTSVIPRLQAVGGADCTARLQH